MPNFISQSSMLLPSWVEAFSDATLSVGLPKRFDLFDATPLFLDVTGLSQPEKNVWLKHCVASKKSIIVLSPLPEEAEALQVIKNGAAGYGHTYSSAQLLQEMLLTVNRGGLWLGNKLIQRVMAQLARSVASLPKHASTADRALNSSTDTTSNNTLVAKQTLKQGAQAYADVLSEREVAVGRHVALGQTNTEISEVLSIKERTVKAHITSIFHKLQVRNRVELALLLNGIKIERTSI